MMYDTCLVQRLTAPSTSDMHDKIEHVFGGASKIDMGPEGFKILRTIFTFDYMGAAEYEFGSVPRVLKALAEDHDKLMATHIVVPADKIEPNWKRQRPKRTAKGKIAKKQPVFPPINDKVVYVLCRKEHLSEVDKRVNLLAGSKIRTKMGTRFPETLDPIGEFDGKVTGWLELDNGFLFFVDKVMWRKTTALFTGEDPAPETP